MMWGKLIYALVLCLGCCLEQGGRDVAGVFWALGSSPLLSCLVLVGIMSRLVHFDRTQWACEATESGFQQNIGMFAKRMP
jgi:hypothetical protein